MLSSTWVAESGCAGEGEEALKDVGGFVWDLKKSKVDRRRDFLSRAPFPAFL